jgi:hypothetical protein
MNAGITSANLFVSGGATFNGAIGLQNTELIRNNTFGMIDLMPGTTSTSRFGLRVDTTSWAFGTRLDAIRGDGSISPSSYGLWFNNPLYLNADADFAFNTNGAARIRYSTTGNDTLQYVVTCANANSSGKKKLNFNDFIPVWYKKEVTEKDLEMKLLQLKHSYPHKVYKEKT